MFWICWKTLRVLCKLDAWLFFLLTALGRQRGVCHVPKCRNDPCNEVTVIKSKVVLSGYLLGKWEIASLFAYVIGFREKKYFPLNNSPNERNPCFSASAIVLGLCLPSLMRENVSFIDPWRWFIYKKKSNWFWPKRNKREKMSVGSKSCSRLVHTHKKKKMS